MKPMEKMTSMSPRTKAVIALALVAIGVAGRLLPHAWNFAPIVAIGLFAGARLGKRYALIVPVAAMILSDALIGFYGWQINLTVYGAMALAGVVGLALRRTRNPFAIASGSVAASTLFFLITNGAVWLWGAMYASNIAGLMASYSAGLPFYRNAIVGDAWYSLAIFGAFELAALAVGAVRRIRTETISTQ